MATVSELRLSFLEENILKHFSNLVEKDIAEAHQIILFGSRARGDSNENSDLDVAVILNVPHIDKRMWNRVWDIKWRVLESFHAEEFPLSLSLLPLNDLTSKDFGVEKTIKTKGTIVWQRKN